ncbi:MAG: hypothetical protein QXK90_02850 [Candidatus Parvarchaeota archaeon]
METYRLDLLDSLYYNSFIDSGAAGATSTAPLVGDIALMYSISRSLGIGKLDSRISSVPHYSELSELPFVVSVAHSLGPVKMLPAYDFSASFISEGYFDYNAFKSTFNAPFRNWIRMQGIAAGNSFYFSVAYRDRISLPDKFSVRLGNMRSCIARVEKVVAPDGYSIWGNAYTSMLISEKWNERKPLSIPEYVEKEILSAYYIIYKGLSIDDWLRMVEPYE